MLLRRECEIYTWWWWIGSVLNQPKAHILTKTSLPRSPPPPWKLLFPHPMCIRINWRRIWALLKDLCTATVGLKTNLLVRTFSLPFFSWTPYPHSKAHVYKFFFTRLKSELFYINQTNQKGGNQKNMVLDTNTNISLGKKPRTASSSSPNCKLTLFLRPAIWLHQYSQAIGET